MRVSVLLEERFACGLQYVRYIGYELRKMPDALCGFLAERIKKRGDDGSLGEQNIGHCGIMLIDYSINRWILSIMDE